MIDSKQIIFMPAPIKWIITLILSVVFCIAMWVAVEFVGPERKTEYA